MAGLGEYLSGLREERGLSIDEMARVTRVASRYLEALEREDLTALPAPVFTKGYIRAYCQALGVHADEALGRYTGGGPAAATPAPVAARTTDARRGRGTLLVSFALLVGFGLALFVVALSLQSGRPEVGTRQAALPAGSDAPAPRPVTGDAPSPPVSSSPPARSTTDAPVVPSARPAAPVATAGPVPDVRQPDAKPTSPTEPRPMAEGARAAAIATTVPALPPGSVVSPYRLIARASESTWLRVRTEDGRTFEETIPAGEVREWVSNRPFVLTVGNAGGITLELNGQKLPPLGTRGVVIGNLVLPPPAP
jgi:cytoskeleton protein RodZ